MSFIPLPLFLSASLYIVRNILQERGGAVRGDVPGRCGLLELWIGVGSVGAMLHGDFCKIGGPGLGLT